MQDKKINQKDKLARAQGYWHGISGEFYYKGVYVDNEPFGLFECFFNIAIGKEFYYYAR